MFKIFGIKTLYRVIDTINLYNHALKIAKTTLKINDPQVPDTPYCYGDEKMEELHEKIMLPLVEKETDLELYPTYNYFRVYKNGDVLLPHSDRPSCEISVTMCLGYDSKNRWAICIKDYKDNIHKIKQNPGDALIYRGCDLLHWRGVFIGNNHVQIFLHYVDKNGPYAEWKFDKRLNVEKNQQG